MRAGYRKGLGRVAHTGCAPGAYGGIAESAAGTCSRIAPRTAEGEVYLRMGRADFIDRSSPADFCEDAGEERDVFGRIQRTRSGAVRISGPLGSRGDAGKKKIAQMELAGRFRAGQMFQ